MLFLSVTETHHDLEQRGLGTGKGLPFDNTVTKSELMV